MISIIALLITLTMLGMIVMQSLFVYGYQDFLKLGNSTVDSFERQGLELGSDASDQGNLPSPVPFYAPHAAIILCLRGADETLIDCLTGLLAQNYPAYEIHLVFDSEEDPSKQVIDDFFKDNKAKPKIHIFEPQPNCSFKCSGIVHAIKHLNEEVKVIAFVDADTIVDETWLPNLVTPLNDDSIGATTGNRWFTPEDREDRSLIQATWNAAAVVQMFKYKIAWGGSMAMRREVIERCGLLEKWSHSYCEDTSLAYPFRRNRLRLHRVHDLILDNNEPSTPSETFDWMFRQLLTAKLHHNRWFDIMIHGLLTGVTSIVAPIALIVMLVTGHIVPGLAILKAWLVYQVFNMILLWIIEDGNREVLDARQAFNRVTQVKKPSIFERFYAAMATQFFHPLATLKAMTATQVKWRGVTYSIRGKRLEVLKIAKPATETV